MTSLGFVLQEATLIWYPIACVICSSKIAAVCWSHLVSLASPMRGARVARHFFTLPYTIVCNDTKPSFGLIDYGLVRSKLFTIQLNIQYTSPGCFNIAVSLYSINSCSCSIQDSVQLVINMKEGYLHAVALYSSTRAWQKVNSGFPSAYWSHYPASNQLKV